MLDDYYLNLDYSPKHLLSLMYEEASVAENYYMSPAKVLRCDASSFLRTELSKLINAPFTCCGFLKTPPLGIYPIHTDVFRIASINMPLFEETVGFQSYMYINKTLEPIGYKTNNFTLLNVMKPHGIENKNPEKERLMLSIGFKNHSYSTLREMHFNGELINVAV
jgi:hypothetical protein